MTLKFHSCLLLFFIVSFQAFGQNQKRTFRNPVFEPVLADPSLIKNCSYFYAYGTEDNWADEGGYHLVPVVRSQDLTNWEFRGNAMLSKPTWKEKGGIWAPDVSEVDGKFYMYYSYSTWGDPNPGIGLAISDLPEGPFIDQGKVFDSEDIGVKNSIDPYYWEENGKKYLIWGSFHGLFLTQLSSDGKKAIGKKTQLAGNHLEASYIYFRDGYYYLFGSAGTCCEGEKSTYKVLVGRSKKLKGPYLDKNGNSLLCFGTGTLVVEGSSQVAGPGHNAELVTDVRGQEWLLYHGMLRTKPKLGNGANRRALFLDPIQWEDNWPTIVNQVPNLKPQAIPSFQKELF